MQQYCTSINVVLLYGYSYLICMHFLQFPPFSLLHTIHVLVAIARFSLLSIGATKLMNALSNLSLVPCTSFSLREGAMPRAFDLSFNNRMSITSLLEGKICVIPFLLRSLALTTATWTKIIGAKSAEVLAFFLQKDGFPFMVTILIIK